MHYKRNSEDHLIKHQEIQNFGYIIGLNKNYSIQFYSENIKALFDTNFDILNKPIYIFPIIENWLLNYNLHQKDIEISIDIISIKHKEYYIQLFQSDNDIYIQLEEKIKTDKILSLNYLKIKSYESLKNQISLWKKLVKDIYEFTKYDRVMLYKLLDDGNGKVIAEYKRKSIESHLNVYYPKENFSEEDRIFFKLNRRRLIRDVNESNSMIISTESKIDLTSSDAISMPTKYIEHLKSINVKSSFSISIIVDNKLWGIVTCQNIEAKHIDLHHRIYSENLTDWVTKLFTIQKYKKLNELNFKIDVSVDKLKSKLLKYEELRQGISSHFNDFLMLTETDGIAYINNGEILINGVTPSIKKINQIIQWYIENFTTKNKLYTERAFAKKFPDLVDNPSDTAGIVIVELHRIDCKYFIWFRKEFIENTKWSNCPIKLITRINSNENEILNTNSLFEIYEREERGQSKSWTNENLLTINKLHLLIYELKFNHFRKIQELNIQLSQTNNELDSFAYTLSHDLGTPLTVSKLNLQLLERKLNNSSDNQDIISSVLKQINNMEKMMKNILELSRASRVDLHFDTVNMKNIISEIVQDNLVLFNNTIVVVDKTIDLYCDYTLIYQVFQNIISNAFKYSSKESSPQVTITSEESEEYIIYSISDNGIGIPESQMNELFQLFKRLDNSSNFNGNGVGLAIVHKILSRLDGKCKVYSNIEKGSTFKLYFRK